MQVVVALKTHGLVEGDAGESDVGDGCYYDGSGDDAHEHEKMMEKAMMTGLNFEGYLDEVEGSGGIEEGAA